MKSIYGVVELLPKIYPDVEERERKAKTGGEARRGGRGDSLPSSGSKTEDLNAGR